MKKNKIIIIFVIEFAIASIIMYLIEGISGKDFSLFYTILIFMSIYAVY